MIFTAWSWAAYCHRHFSADHSRYTSSPRAFNLLGHAVWNANRLGVAYRLADCVGNPFYASLLLVTANRIRHLFRMAFLNHAADLVGDRLGALFTNHAADFIGNRLSALFANHVANFIGNGLRAVLTNHTADLISDCLRALFWNHAANLVVHRLYAVLTHHVANFIVNFFGACL